MKLIVPHSNDTTYSSMSKRLLSTSVKEGLKQSDQDQGCESKIFYVQKSIAILKLAALSLLALDTL